MTINELLSQIPENLLMPVIIGYLIGSLVAAFFGFRLFKLSVILSFSAMAFAAGYGIFTLAFGDNTELLAVGLVLGLACAVICGLIAVKLYKGLIYFFGGLIGVGIGFAVPYLILSDLGYASIGLCVGIVLAIVLAVVGAKLMYRFLKVIVIINSAFTGISGAVTALLMLVAPDNAFLNGISGFVILVFGIYATIIQFRHNKGRRALD